MCQQFLRLNQYSLLEHYRYVKSTNIEFTVSGCSTINSIYFNWQKSFSERPANIDPWASSTRQDINLDSTQTNANFATLTLTRQILSIDLSVNVDIRISLSCDTTTPTDVPIAGFVKSRMGLITAANSITNAGYTTSNVNSVKYEIWNLVPNDTPSLLFANDDNKNLFFYYKTKPLLMLSTEDMKGFQGTLEWSDTLGGFVAKINTTLIIGDTASLEVFLFYDRVMGAKLSSPVQISRSDQTNIFVSDKIVGGPELVGKIIYLKFNNKRLPFMTIFNQSQECMTSTNLCYGVPLRTYGYALLTQDSEVVQIYITPMQDGTFKFRGKIKKERKDYYLDQNNQINFRFSNAFISATASLDKDGDYGFNQLVSLSNRGIKALGQVILLMPPKQSVAIPMGIGNLNTDKLPYNPETSSSTLATEESILPKEDQDTFKTTVFVILLGGALLGAVVFATFQRKFLSLYHGRDMFDDDSPTFSSKKRKKYKPRPGLTPSQQKFEEEQEIRRRNLVEDLESDSPDLL